MITVDTSNVILDATTCSTGGTSKSNYLKVAIEAIYFVVSVGIFMSSVASTTVKMEPSGN